MIPVQTINTEPPKKIWLAYPFFDDWIISKRFLAHVHLQTIYYLRLLELEILISSIHFRYQILKDIWKMSYLLFEFNQRTMFYNIITFHIWSYYFYFSFRYYSPIFFYGLDLAIQISIVMYLLFKLKNPSPFDISLDSIKLSNFIF